MNRSLSMIPWVIQTNVGPEDDITFYCDALKRRGNPYQKIMVAPFTDAPAIEGALKYLYKQGIKPNEPTIWLGGIGFLEALRKTGLWSKYIFTDSESFNLQRYNKEWGNRMLNSEESGIFTTLGNFLALPGPPDELVFIRPIKDLKEFPGAIVARINVRRWVGQIQGRGFSIDENCEIYVGKPFGISHEWRLFMVKGKVVTGSYYTSEKYGPEEYTPPQDVVDYAEECAKIYSPAPIFCLDICKTAGNLYIMEAGSYHSAGLYRSSAAKIVETISNYWEEQ